MNKGTKNKLTDEQRAEIRALKGKESGHKVGKRFGVSHTTVYKIWKKQNMETTPKLETISKISAPKIATVATPRPRKTPKKDYIKIKDPEDLYKLVRKVNEGEIVIDPKYSDDLKRMKEGCAKTPFGGINNKSGGWNSIVYVVCKILTGSERVCLEKGRD